ncbi:glycosyltransferase family 2 protein [Ruegeria atlantica]|uniref:N-acetylglucosaminyl-diphospho-decaprenol L-rhamnosyltransferase n=1 Tax=Ruegeria atlantica TaxID=81569 RepID=A0A0P1EFX3_9RHOB|nr:glycosyltransferase family 2 protein [Ruegeria atlantica]CUH49053.1 N-acetylglucosaminyl-diphospho-decaprenol L-rhamnosyltransferase [Ruegeria atlantica]
MIRLSINLWKSFVSAFEPKVTIIVVSYNTREMTLECLRSVQAETHVPYELIVVDNTSTDGSAEAIAHEFRNITLLAEEDNHGFAKANNIAAERANGEYILLLNPDTVVLDGAIDKLVTFAEARPDAGVWGGRTLYGDRSLNPTSCWRRMSLWNIFCRTFGLTGIFPNSPVFHSEAYGGWDRSTERLVDIVTGCFLLIKREDWKALGGFDLTFFMYGEEADLCLRAAQTLGASPRMTPDAVIIHYGGASEKVRSDKMVRLLRAKSELISRHIPGWQRPLAKALFAFWPLNRRLAYSVLRPDEDNAQVWSEIWKRRQEWRRGFSD